MLAQTDPFKLLVIGAPEFRINGVDVEARPWVSATEVDDLRRIDIGVMPLRDDPWARGKCALKALQYMALGIPTICSPVGANAEVITHGRNGLLAATDDEWVDALRRLVRSPADRRVLGEAGLQTVQTRYSRDVHAPTVARIFRRACGKDGGQTPQDEQERAS
jgi:glycosyltransferase involved in cell wall biosynthesis